MVFAGFSARALATRINDSSCKIVEKHKVNQFYTAPTVIRALAKQSIKCIEKYDLSSLKVLGSVGEPINEEAWHWYNDNIGKKRSPIVDTWWQTETGGIMISPIPFATPTKPTYATLPFPGIQPVLLRDDGSEVSENQELGKLCIQYPWPSIARTIWGNHERFRETYFSQFEGNYFTGDGAFRDEVGFPHEIKGNALYGFVILKETGEWRLHDNVRK